MKKIDNYQYSIDDDGTLKIYTKYNGRTYIIAELEECIDTANATDDGIEELIEEYLYDIGYELI